MDRFAWMEFFVLTVDLVGLTRTAERLRMSHTAVSRTLSALEDRLGVRLIVRITRRL
jgi:DNA-binding transcriptional LysR family regulator